MLLISSPSIVPFFFVPADGFTSLTVDYRSAHCYQQPGKLTPDYHVRPYKVQLFWKIWRNCCKIYVNSRQKNDLKLMKRSTSMLTKLEDSSSLAHWLEKVQKTQKAEFIYTETQSLHFLFLIGWYHFVAQPYLEKVTEAHPLTPRAAKRVAWVEILPRMRVKSRLKTFLFKTAYNC